MYANVGTQVNNNENLLTINYLLNLLIHPLERYITALIKYTSRGIILISMPFNQQIYAFLKFYSNHLQLKIYIQFSKYNQQTNKIL